MWQSEPRRVALTKKKWLLIMKLGEKHGDKFSRFQFKIWAESLASGQYSDLETPPGYATEKKTSREGNVESVMNGMLSIMNTLCQAITPTSSPPGSKRSGSTLSPMSCEVLT